MAAMTRPAQHLRQVCIIVNPVSGTNREVLEIIQRFTAERTNIRWEIRQTEKAGDARQFAQEAAAGGVDVVAACGGDGTVTEVADGLREVGTPMAILPVGTANVMAAELSIPPALPDALALIWSEDHVIQEVDMGCLDNAYFTLRVGIGYEAQVSAGAQREEKARLGRLAYLWTALRGLRKLRPVRYRLTLDDQTILTWGVTCMICNSANLGYPNLKMVPGTSVTDGLLDVVVIYRANIGTAIQIIASALQGLLPFLRDTRPLLEYWQARRVVVECNRPQIVAYDGEFMKRARRVTAWVVPRAVRIIVPPPIIVERIMPSYETIDLTSRVSQSTA